MAIGDNNTSGGETIIKVLRRHTLGIFDVSEKECGNWGIVKTWGLYKFDVFLTENLNKELILKWEWVKKDLWRGVNITDIQLQPIKLIQLTFNWNE